MIWQTPPGQTPHPPGQTPPPQETATAADGTHHTGMHFCSGYGLSAESTRTVAEGISYLYCWHVSPYTGNPQSTETRGIGDLGKGALDLMEVLRQVSPAECIGGCMPFIELGVMDLRFPFHISSKRFRLKGYWRLYAFTTHLLNI